MKSRVLSALFLGALSWGCQEMEHGAIDANPGSGMDGGANSGVDAAPAQDAAPVDAGPTPDAGPCDHDAGIVDAGGTVDAGSVDGGGIIIVGADAGPCGVDAGPR